MLDWFYISSCLVIPRGPPGGAEEHCWGGGHLGYLTLSHISSRKWTDGWTCVFCIFIHCSSTILYMSTAPNRLNKSSYTLRSSWHGVYWYYWEVSLCNTQLSVFKNECYHIVLMMTYSTCLFVYMYSCPLVYSRDCYNYYVLCSRSKRSEGLLVRWT